MRSKLSLYLRCRLALLVLAALSLSACGPESASERVDEEEDREISSNMAGVTLYAVDGSGCTDTGCKAWNDVLLNLPPPYDGQTTIIHRFYKGYGGPKRYWSGPELSGAKVNTIRDQVVQRVCADFRAGGKGAALAGGSRGAVIVVDAAHKILSDAGCRVNGKAPPIVFIGAVDAVDSLTWNLDKRAPANVPTHHRVKANTWQGFLTTVDLPGAVVSVAPRLDENGNPIDHAKVLFHKSSLSWLATTAIARGLPVVGPFGVAPGSESALRTGPCVRNATGAGFCFHMARIRAQSDGRACRAPMEEWRLAAYPSSKCWERLGGQCTMATVCRSYANARECEDREPFSPRPSSVCGS